MNRKNKPTELSYYGLYLANHLKESHPDKAGDAEFIERRAEEAAEVYEQSRRAGYPPQGAHEMAMAALVKDLHFSKHDMLRDVLATEFEEEVSEADIPALTRKLLPLLENVFSIYPLSDDFAQSSGYDLLYTELTGAVALYLEEHGI